MATERPSDTTQRSDEAAWAGIIDLIEAVAGSGELVAETVAEVRGSVREIAVLAPSDIARHTRALLAAATRALAARRGPTEAELSFVADLGETRARQGVPIHAVLAAIHVTERRIWRRARAAAAARGIDAGLLLEARALYDDWAQDVRQALMLAHRAAEGTDAGTCDEREARWLHRLLQGGSAARLAAVEAGFAADGALVVLSAPVDTVVGPVVNTVVGGAPGPGWLRSALPRGKPAVVGADGTDVLAVLASLPNLPSLASLRVAVPSGVPVGVAGPGAAEELPVLRRRAGSAARAAAELGRDGLVHVADVAAVVALEDRGDLAAVLLERYGPALDALGGQAAPTVDTVRTWLELGRDAERAAEVLFVHPNTVRNRVHALTEATGLNPRDTFGGVDLWWLCRSWATRPG